MRDEAQKVYYEARVQAWKDYEEVVAQIVKRYEEDRDKPWKVYEEAIAEADKVYEETSK